LAVLLLLLLFGELLQLILLGDGDHLRHRPITHIQQTPSSTHTHTQKRIVILCPVPPMWRPDGRTD
jgi:hypothetical protein